MVEPNSTQPDAARMRALIHEVAGHLFRGRADLARAPLGELARALPGHAGVQQMQRQAAAVGFSWPAQRAAYAPAPRAAPASGDVDLVAFHVDLPAAPSGIHGAIDYTTVLAQSFESARLRAPGARRLLLTDEATRVPQGMAVDQVLRFAIDREQLMFERMRVQASYLRGRDAPRASVLMDSDVVVNIDPAAVFAEDFDVGLTWRPEFPDAPFNGGMIFVAPGSQGAAFFDKARACYEALAADAAVAGAFPRSLRAWWGDQFALAALVGYREFAERRGDALAVDGIRVRFFPCETHNFTLEPSRQYRTEELRRKYFIHFKGNRKALQSQYLDAMRAGKV
jgi:hypothetical protein